MKTALRFTWIFLCLALALAARCWNLRDVFIEGHIYFVDGDCYSRMTRARMIAEHPGMIVRHHDFENWPQGVTAHTTAPLDYLIVSLKWVLDAAFRVFDNAKTPSLLHAQTLDLAGALISPLLGLAALLFLAWWLEKFRVRFGWAALLFYAVCPIIVHGTLLGRPDHQSLLMLTLTVALGAELALARAKEPNELGTNEWRWGLVSGIAWGVSLWVSLYEPIILLALVIALWLVLDRRALFSRQRLPGVVVCLAILSLSVVLEGWPVAIPDATVRSYFSNWERTIGELSHLTPMQLFPWVGWWIVASPVLLFLAWRTDRRALPLLLILAAAVALTLWQARWGYFLAIVFAWTLPWQMQALRRTWAAWVFFLAGSWPILQDWDTSLFEVAPEQRHLKRSEMVALRGLSEVAIGKHGGAFLASWWLSPAIAYWSRQPGVAGTSHESLPGIVDTARFFLSTDPLAAGAILKKRSVRWVLADDAGREIETSTTLLGIPTPTGETMAAALANHPEDAPDFLAEWKGASAVRPDGLRFYRLYGVDDVMLPP